MNSNSNNSHSPNIPFKVGFGFDAHQFELKKSNKPLILGGFLIENHIGLKAHSDGDVVLHSLCDALLGALSLDEICDIGDLFPDFDPAYKNKSSCFFVEQVLGLVDKNDFTIGNVDITILAETPKLQKIKIEIKKNIAKLLKLEPSNVSVKASTTEKMDSVGEKKGIFCYSSVLIYKDK